MSEKKLTYAREDGMRFYMLSTIGGQNYLMATDMELVPFIEQIEELDWIGGEVGCIYTTTSFGWRPLIGTSALRSKHIETVMAYPIEHAAAQGLVAARRNSSTLDLNDIEIPDSVPKWMTEEFGNDVPD